MAEDKSNLTESTEFLLRQISRTLWRNGRKILTQHGVTHPQFDALVILKFYGDMTIGDLSNRLYLAYSTTTDLVDRLERAGFVVRERDTEDRRVVYVRMQKLGVDLYQEVVQARQAYLSGILGDLDIEEQKKIAVLLKKMSGLVDA